MCLLCLAGSWGDGGNHRHAGAGASHAALQQPGELGVSEGHVDCVAIRKLGNDCAQGQQALVDVGALLGMVLGQSGLHADSKLDPEHARTRTKWSRFLLADCVEIV